MTQTLSLKGKTALFIVAPEKFQDDEFGKPYELLQQGGVRITIASSRKGTLTGVFGRHILADGVLADYKAADFDAVLFIGGPGSSIFFDDPQAHRLAREALAAEKVKVLAAICIAPATLARAGMLAGKRATAFVSVHGDLAAGGAKTDARQDVVQDGKIITAAGPHAAAEFARKISAVLAAH